MSAEPNRGKRSFDWLTLKLNQVFDLYNTGKTTAKWDEQLRRENSSLKVLFQD